MPRRAARVVVIDPGGRTLLLKGHDPARPQDDAFWFVPGGGIDEGESDEQAARRELNEEVGIAVVELGPVRHRRQASFVFDGVDYEQTEVYFVAQVDTFVPDSSGWTELERRCMLGFRWWSVEELRRTADIVFPEGLADLLSSWTS